MPNFGRVLTFGRLLHNVQFLRTIVFNSCIDSLILHIYIYNFFSPLSLSTPSSLIGRSIFYSLCFTLINSQTLTITSLIHSISLTTSSFVNCSHNNIQWFSISHSINQDNQIVQPGFGHSKYILF